jgi:hypothetical protein
MSALFFVNQLITVRPEPSDKAQDRPFEGPRSENELCHLKVDFDGLSPSGNW